MTEAEGRGDERLGLRLGVWEIRRRIGAGGMGTVYAAVRADDEFQQLVAVKCLARGVENSDAVRRFRAERQFLADLSHPNIAALLDGGATPDNQPFLVMEYVDGVPITEWADAQRLTIPERLRLFLQLCSAVTFAHQHLIVHRDLKPGNILVTKDGVVKLLDFGIAKLLIEDGEFASQQQTLGGGKSFTPEYASPEQVQGLPIGTSSDVYALGVILFELLAGRQPFTLTGKSPSDIEEIICRTAPPRPSAMLDVARAHALGERSVARARQRIQGDLDAIVLVTLNKEPARRYGSVDAMARDLELYLDGSPVVARPDSVGYRFGKLVRRHRFMTAAAVLALFSLVGGLLGASALKRRAETQRARATEMTSFITGMLSAPDPARQGRNVLMREVIDVAAARADSQSISPGLGAEIRTVIGDTYLALGEFESAAQQYQHALAAHRQVAPAGANVLVSAMNRVSTALEFQGRYEEADSVLREAESLVERYPLEDPLDVAALHDSRARLLISMGKMAEAAPLLEQALRLQQRHAPENDSALAYAYSNLGMVSSELNDNLRADTLYAAALAASRRAHGDEHPLVAGILSAYATVAERLGQLERSDSLLRAVLDMRRRLLGPEHPEYAWTMFNYADHLVRTGRWSEGAHWAREVLKLRGRSLPETHVAVGTALLVLGRALTRLDSLDAAEAAMREGLALRRKTFPEGHWLLASTESTLGELFVVAGRFKEAEALLLPSERALVELRGEEAPVVEDARRRIVELYTRWQRPEEAARWQARLTSTEKS